MKIAIIGTGISSMTAAWLLHKDHELTVFEADNRVGGHTNTVKADLDGQTWNVDTGFIVFNDRTYPNFIRLIDLLGVSWKPSNMSFGVRCDRSGLEWASMNLNALFTRRSSLLNPFFYRMVADILRFNRTAGELLHTGSEAETLGSYLNRKRYSRSFIEHYIVPMGAAVWSGSSRQMLEFPARYFVQFFTNHGMLQIFNQPVWRVIRGGSISYMEKLVLPFRNRIRLNAPVTRIERHGEYVTVKTPATEAERFDHVIIGAHSDQALRMLGDASNAEQEILGRFSYQENKAVLHYDERLLSSHRRAWASWNYHIPENPEDPVSVTYYMNRLQGLDAPHAFSVTLNNAKAIRPDRVIRTFTYHHPVYTAEAVAAQKRHTDISGRNRTHYCGAYWGYGFHEDGVNSGIAVASAFGRRFPD